MHTNLAHERFIAAMKQHGNATRAYQAAYPGASYASARAHASRLMKNPYVQQMLSEHDVSACEEATKQQLAATIQRLEAYYDQQAAFLHIIETGEIEKTGPNGEKTRKPATINDKLRAAQAIINHTEAFLARHPMHQSVKNYWENG